MILQELMSNFDEIINDPHGKKVLMYLIAPRNTKHLQYDLVQLMKSSDKLNTSKKDADIRQRELFEYCKSYFLEYFTGNILSTFKDGSKGFMMTEMIERLNTNDDLTAFYKELSSTLSTSSVEPQAETNLIEQIDHYFLRRKQYLQHNIDVSLNVSKWLLEHIVFYSVETLRFFLFVNILTAKILNC